ncbi:MAG: hypothetical protein EOS10_00275 [Mesorhizobium sp.]|uniref:hypothetical protein n=1 Tax=Mesorhizobium sp. TaxID=1871066 RepID=UPI000FE4F987|nr:hypothetical protein [Mesorhizobium sp.]RWO34774.1 MAG: hypothetical protein EOS10_00275 [Mesorhizobium sp.]
MNLPGYDAWKLRSPEDERDRYRRVPDDFSIEYEFEEIEIEEDGIAFGSFYGTAELALNDPRDGDFYVKHIAVDGVKRERERVGGYGMSILKRTDVVMLLPMPARDERTFKAHLFRKIEAALYASRDAAEHFAKEMEA